MRALVGVDPVRNGPFRSPAALLRPELWPDCTSQRHRFRARDSEDPGMQRIRVRDRQAPVGACRIGHSPWGDDIMAFRFKLQYLLRY
jgi:hypothetical protein